MSKRLWSIWTTAPAMVGSAMLLVNPALAQTNSVAETLAEVEAIAQNEPTADFATPAINLESANSELLEQIDSYSNEEFNGSMGADVQGAAKFRDVSPGDWAYQALDDLVKRYDCLVGYPNGTFRGNRSLSRYEFAAGLNACLNQIERLIAAATADFVTRDDLETIRKLMEQFEAELIALGTRIDNLEARTSFLEDHQFSTTTKLKGEVLFVVSDLFTDTDQTFDTNFDRVIDGNDTAPGGGNTTFADRVRLTFDTSFTGKDLLRVRLNTRNINDSTLRGITNEGRFGFSGDDGNDVGIDRITYQLPIADGRGKFYVYAVGGDIRKIMKTVSPFSSSGTGALSRFGRFNPIYRVGGQEATIGAAFQLTDWLRVSGAYSSGEANNPSAGNGLFNGDYAMGGQVTIKPFDGRLTLAGTFIHAYRDNGVRTGAGTLASDFRVTNALVSGGDVPVVSNNYGLGVKFDITDDIFVGGWGGYTAARAVGTGDGDIWNWNAYVGIKDLGGDGNVLALMAGREPYLAGTSSPLTVRGLGAGNRADEDVSFHFEGFYKMKVSRNILITPGIIVITNPGAQDLNDTLWIGTIRTTFKF